MRASELDYELPAELIAQRGLEPRDDARLLVYQRASGAVRHRRFRDLPEELAAGELLVLNDTKVIPARLELQRPNGGAAEVLLLEPVEDGLWEALAGPSRRLCPAMRLGPVEFLEPRGDGRWLVRLDGEPSGELPPPPYIHAPLDDPERCQTVYARAAGSAAAPTAGPHFTPQLLARLPRVERVTLHVGHDTFHPLASDAPEAHQLHGERYEVREDVWERIRSAGRVVAVGTTTVRVLETVAAGGGLAGRTDLFITPATRSAASTRS